MRKGGGNPGLKGRLLDKSIEAYILSLETINCLSIRYRVETFTYLVCNAWELLLKAKVITDYGATKAVYYPRKRGEKKRSLALRDCLKRVFPNESDPVRLNVEKIADLRDEACHLVISSVPKEILALFQSSVLNYHRLLNAWFQKSLSDRVSVGMMTIVYDFDPAEFDLSNPRLRRKMGTDTATFLLGYQASLQQEYDRLGKPAEFSIDIDYRLAFTKKPGEADISLSKGDGGAATRILEVPKDAGRTHPYRLSDAVAIVSERVGPSKVNSFDLQCANRIYDVEKRPELFHHNSIKGSPKQYSPAYVEWLVCEHKKDNDFFKRVREKCKALP